jgi:uncharacterized protein (TIGR02246 family)
MSTEAHAPIEAEISEVVAEHERAWNAHDADRLIALFEDPMDFVNVLGMHQRSAAALRQDYAHAHATFMKNSVIRMRLNDARRLNDDEVAVAHAYWEMSGMGKLPGWNPPDVRHGVLTYVLVRRGEKWKITAAQNTDVVKMPGK